MPTCSILRRRLGDCVITVSNDICEMLNSRWMRSPRLVCSRGWCMRAPNTVASPKTRWDDRAPISCAALFSGSCGKKSCGMTGELRQVLRRLTRPAWLGTLRRTSPLSTQWGIDRGTPVDRHYIHVFLELWSSDIRGRVLEVGTDRYTTRFGRGVESAEVLDIDATNRAATIVADLS